MLHTFHDAAVMSWSAEEDMNLEYFPHQIVQALRLTRPAKTKRYRLIPPLQHFFYANNRFCLQIGNDRFSLRYLLTQKWMLATRGFKIVRMLLLTYDEYKRNGVTARKM